MVEKIKSYLQEYSYLKSIQSLLYWDMETMMPSGAIDDRAQRISYVQGKIHALLTSKKYQNLLEDFSITKKSHLEKKLFRELRWDFQLNHALPTSHVKEITHVQTIASHVWAQTRKSNDWESFRPHLETLVKLKKREASFFKEKKPYDALIRIHDKEFSSKEIDRLFFKLKGGLLDLVAKVNRDGKFTKISDLNGPFNIESQKNLSQFVTKLCGLPNEFSRLDVSTHPFSINISPRDQRITTRYVTMNLDSLSSTMHEVGHALYELHLPQEWEGTPFQEAISLSVHESQSRFWENVVGRSLEFCRFLHPKMKELFPSSMKGVTPEKLFRVFNKSHPGLIRVESSELYYNLHIIIRYEIEEMIFNHDYPVREVPSLWNKKYLDYLGLLPSTNSEGVLQDSHWAGGAFGYFPTYTLGNLISGTLYRKLKNEKRNFRNDIEQGDLSFVNSFLNKAVHEKGRSVTARDIIGKLDVDDYLSYLKEKFKVI